MNVIEARRPPFSLEAVGPWLVLLVGLSLLEASLFVGPAAVLKLRPGSALTGQFLSSLQGAITRYAPVIAILAIVPRWLPRRSPWRWPLLALTAVLAIVLGAAAYELLLMVRYGCCDYMTMARRLAVIHDLAVRTIVLTIVIGYRRSFIDAAEDLHSAQLNQLNVQREVAAASLQLLHAQIEPHFLFNSLANVRRLLQTDGLQGRAMLGDLLRYLQTALPKLRDDAPTLEREIETIRAYLGVHQVRMGPRLKVEFDIPPSLQDRVVPPMMLITLVENAIKHGLQPLHQGGSIRIAAIGSARSLRIDVADTGRGLTSSEGTGNGLVNIRIRLRSMYGSAARLSLRVNQPRGVVASIEIPLQPNG